MVWSEQIGNALIIPADRADGDGRDWISIGEEVPSELSTFLTAGIFFRSGTYVAAGTAMKVKYFGMGAKGGNLFQFVYIENHNNIAGNHKLVKLTSWLIDQFGSIRSAYGPYVNNDRDISPVANYIDGGPLRDGTQGSPVIMYDEISGTFRGNMLDTGVFGYDYFSATYRPPSVMLTVDGMVTLSGLICLDASPIGGKRLATLPARYRPVRREIFLCSGGNNRVWRCDVLANGDVIIASASSADWAFVGGSDYLSFSGITFASAEFG